MKTKKRDLDYYLKLNYTVSLKRSPDGSYFVKIEELPGCMTEGDSKEDALMMIEDAKLVWLEGALAEGISIPKLVSFSI